MRGFRWSVCLALSAMLALWLGRAQAADQDWDACVNEDGNASYIGCEAFLKRGDTESAHDRAIAYSYLGRLKYIQGDFRGGIEEYTEAIKLDPTMAEAYAGRGWVHHAGSEYALAVADYEQALALRPDYTYLQGKLDAAKAALAGEPTPAATPEQQEAAIAPQPAAAVPVPPAAPAVTFGTRVALVIGNSAYVNVPRLPNPTSDAEAIAQVLRADGFKSVTVVEDASRADMASALQAFQAEADQADWALVYYAGHGIEIGGVNYLVPTDARLKSDRNAPDEAISLSRVLDAISGAKKLKLVMLDACRDNPFAQSMERSVAVRSVARGLTRVEPEGGTLVVYAAKDGNVAEDGAGGHSPFAAALMTRLAEPNLEISKLLRLVTDDVLEATGNRQRPFVYGSVSGREDFYFAVH
jgi:tetratricopeptide (TPR) repeat protein